MVVMAKLELFIMYSLPMLVYSQTTIFINPRTMMKEWNNMHYLLKDLPRSDGKLRMSDYDLKSYGREPRGPLEERPFLLKKAHPQSLIRRSRKSDKIEDFVSETSVKDSFSTQVSSNYRPPPPLVRREILLHPKCHYDNDKWAFHPQSAISHAVMFDRSTGGSCEKCLHKCLRHQKGPWTCRSVVYDSRWNICDLFAIAATSAPFYLVDYEGRDYFEYLNATVPSDSQLIANQEIARRLEETSIVDCKRVMDEMRQKKSSDDVIHEKQHLNSTVYGAIPIQSTSIRQLNDVKDIHKKHARKQKKTNNLLEKQTLPMADPEDELSISSHKKSPEIRRKLSQKRLIVETVFGTDDIKKTKKRMATEKNETPVVSATHITQASTEAKEIEERPSRSFLKPEIVVETLEESDLPLGVFSEKSSSWIRTTQAETNEESSTSNAFILDGQIDDEMGVTRRPETSTSMMEMVARIHHDGETTRRRAPLSIKAIVSSPDDDAKEFLPSKSICPPGRIARMLEFTSTTRRRFMAKTRLADSKSVSECSYLCSSDEQCKSAIFTPSGCQMATTSAELHAQDLFFSMECAYLEKICLPEKYVTAGSFRFPAVVNYMLANSVQQVEDASSLEECLSLCFKAKYRKGLNCQSIMWYPRDQNQNCLLNSESRQSSPDQFMVDQMNYGVVYVESEPSTMKSSQVETKRLHDDVDHVKFTRWSSCTSKQVDQMRFRYQKCKEERDIRKCFKESAFCGHNPHRHPLSHKLSMEKRV